MKNFKIIISLIVSVSVLVFSSLAFSVEPTTFPSPKKQGPKTYPGTIWKSDQTTKKQGKTNVKSGSDSKKIIRKGQKESGVLVEPTMAE